MRWITHTKTNRESILNCNPNQEFDIKLVQSIDFSSTFYVLLTLFWMSDNCFCNCFSWYWSCFIDSNCLFVSLDCFCIIGWSIDLIFLLIWFFSIESSSFLNIWYWYSNIIFFYLLYSLFSGYCFAPKRIKNIMLVMLYNFLYAAVCDLRCRLSVFM